MKERLYKGIMQNGVGIVTVNGALLEDKGKIGFSWGYGGGGPNNLAISLIADYLNYKGDFSLRKKDQYLYDDFVASAGGYFMHIKIAKLPRENNWIMYGEDIEAGLIEYKKILEKESDKCLFSRWSEISAYFKVLR